MNSDWLAKRHLNRGKYANRRFSYESCTTQIPRIFSQQYFIRSLAHSRSSVLTEGNEYEIINSERKDTWLGGSCSPKGAFGYATHIWKMRKSRAHLNLFTSETEFTPSVCLRTVLQMHCQSRHKIPFFLLAVVQLLLKIKWQKCRARKLKAFNFSFTLWKPFLMGRWKPIFPADQHIK